MAGAYRWKGSIIVLPVPAIAPNNADEIMTLRPPDSNVSIKVKATFKVMAVRERRSFAAAAFSEAGVRLANVHPQEDDFPAQIENAVQAFLGSGRDAGARALEPFAYPRREIPKRPQLSVALRCQIFRRDHFHCRYCGGRTILAGVMELLAEVYPEQFPFHRNWKGGQTHPAFISRGAMVDHVEPVALGGIALDPANLVTACNPCNSNKADLTLEQIGWKVQGIVEGEWDGLTCYYRQLWEAAGRPNQSHHTSFMRHLGLAL